GSVGQADLGPMADLAEGLLRETGFVLADNEGLALVNNNAFATGWAALAELAAERLLGEAEVAAALDLEAFAANLSILHALATVVTCAAERTVKLLQSPLSGLPAGLAAEPDTGEEALAEFAGAAQAIAAEARMLAHPVSFEVVSSSKAEGIEDRTTMAPLSARRPAETAALP